jgi:hypothetical protein
MNERLKCCGVDGNNDEGVVTKVHLDVLLLRSAGEDEDFPRPRALIYVDRDLSGQLSFKREDWAALLLFHPTQNSCFHQSNTTFSFNNRQYNNSFSRPTPLTEKRLFLVSLPEGAFPFSKECLYKLAQSAVTAIGRSDVGPIEMKAVIVLQRTQRCTMKYV